MDEVVALSNQLNVIIHKVLTLTPEKLEEI